MTTTFNEQQELAANADDGHVLVLAGAGSGKTSVLTERAVRLIREGMALPREILCITFTNKAANEMKERIAARAGDADLSRMWTCTFHAMCGRILRTFPDLTPFNSNFAIYDMKESSKMVDTILTEFRIKAQYDAQELRPIRGLISRYKNSEHVLVSAETARSKVGYTSLAETYEESEQLSFGEWASQRNPELDQKMLDFVYFTYREKMKAQNALDFDDLLLYALSVLREDEYARSALQDRFKYVMVDEYQDTNPIQYMLVTILAAGHGNLFCVGDDDQSIYGFRGTDIRIIRSFQEDFPDAQVIRLEQNYRSGNGILQAANAVISHNKQRLGKNLWSESMDNTKPIIVNAFNEYDEAEIIVSDIVGHHKLGEKYSSNAVLYRAHVLSKAIEDELIRQGVPYRVHGGLSFYDRKEVKDLMAYMTILVNPQADQQVLRIINVPARGIGPKKVTALLREANDRQRPLMEIMANADRYFANDRALVRKAREFVELYDRLTEGLEDRPVQETVERIYELTGYREMLEKIDVDGDRADNIGELMNIAAAYDEAHGHDFAGFMQHLSLLTDQERASEDGDAVTLMTVHASKGLEFDNVYVAGMVENQFPSYRAIQQGSIEEERRLCYVAITRARKRLMLTTTAVRRVYGSEEQSCTPSRFLDEIPEDQVEFEGEFLDMEDDGLYEWF